MAWIHRIDATGEHKHGPAFVMSGHRIAAMYERGLYPTTGTVDDFEDTYDDRFHQQYIVDCSGC